MVTINASTGVGAAIGNSGFAGLNSLAVNNSGTIYSAVDTFGATTWPLVTINPSTGAGTSVATLNFGSVRPDVRGLAFSAGNVLFAVNDTGPAGGYSDVRGIEYIPEPTVAGLLALGTGLLAWKRKRTL